MQTALQINNLSNHSRSTRIGALLSTSTSTIMTVLLLASMGQGFLSSALLAVAGLAFELLKWSSWQDSWQAHYSHQHDKRNILALLCTLAVILSIGASIATTRSNLAVNAGGYLQATQHRQLITDQIRQKQAAIDVCTAANRITLCARPLQSEVSELQKELNTLEIPKPDEATALIMEVGNITGLSFNQSATLVVTLISIMLDAAGLYFLYKQTEQEPDYSPAPEALTNEPIKAIESAGGLHTHVYGNVNLTVQLGIDDLLTRALNSIQSGEVKPSVRSLSESMELPQHTAQTILYWLAEAGHIQRQEKGRGYFVQ